MAIDLNDEIVQDFLVEAGEILENLTNQVVDLEGRPEDRDLLNAVFRSFHTIKGGAGFLQLENLVEVSHKAEDVFDLLRRGERRVDAALMDTILQVLDVLNGMFEEIRGGQDPGAAPSELIATLKALAVPGGAAPPPAAATPEVAAEPAAPAAPAAPAEGAPDAVLKIIATPAGGDQEISADEYNALLDAVSGPAADAPSAEANAESSEDITEEEFEQLLDNLHGKGKAPTPAEPSRQHAAAAAMMAAAAAASDDITEEEFEQLLDNLHGKGRAPTAGAPPPSPAPAAATASAPAAPAQASPSASAPPASPAAASTTASTSAAPPAPRAESSAADSEDTAQSRAAKASGAGAASAAAPAAETTVRVETSVLDRIMNMVGELVLIRNRLATLQATAGNEEISKTVSALDVVTTDLQMAAMKTRMQPIKKVFGRFPRVVRDLARQLKKEVTLELIGEDTDLDKNLVEALADPLVHLVRNSVDHGIELPAVREAAGKQRCGTVVLSAEQEGDHILLTISDDGAGMDPEKLRAKAVEKGMMDAEAAARLSERECFELIFAAGFSTKTEISDVSGRGVGMDVVKTRIAQLNGVIQIDSRLGKGTTIEIKLPLTLAIMPTLMVTLGRQIFALPLVNVGEIIDFDLGKINRVDGQEVMVVRDKPLPFFYLSRWLVRGVSNYSAGSGHVVIVSVGTQKIGLLVDQLIGQEEVVIKPLGALLHGTKGLAGATITGDGRIALILDLPSLLDRYARR
jgi:two-component system chemotaxis sensor kinase CheA